MFVATVARWVSNSSRWALALTKNCSQSLICDSSGGACDALLARSRALRIGVDLGTFDTLHYCQCFLQLADSLLGQTRATGSVKGRNPEVFSPALLLLGVNVGARLRNTILLRWCCLLCTSHRLPGPLLGRRPRSPQNLHPTCGNVYGRPSSAGHAPRLMRTQKKNTTQFLGTRVSNAPFERKWQGNERRENRRP